MSNEVNNMGESAAGTAMADERAEQQLMPDEHTTVPNPPELEAPPTNPDVKQKWEMPKPVFQQTSGYLPQNFIKDIQTVPDGGGPKAEGLPSRPPAAEPDLSGIDLSPSAAKSDDPIEAQPDLSELLVPEESEPDPAPVIEKSRGVSAPMVVLGLIGILAFIAVFLTVVYYLFLS